jgi:hypothetical protein
MLPFRLCTYFSWMNRERRLVPPNKETDILLSVVSLSLMASGIKYGIPFME